MRARFARQADPGSRPSFLARYLFEKFGFGLMPAVQVQILAFLAKKDSGDDMPGELDDLAALGTSGANPGNCYRDLMKIIEPKFLLAKAIVTFALPLWEVKSIAGRTVATWQSKFISCCFLYCQGFMPRSEMPP